MAIAGFDPSTTQAQGGYIDQSAVEEVLNAPTLPLGQIPGTDYRYYILESERNNDVIARNALYKHIGDGDSHFGKRRSALVQMLNRRTIASYGVGDSIVVPTRYDVDFRAYSPFPLKYAGGQEFETLIVLDKTLQAFAAYEHGHLARWGIINTGDPADAPTPNGRFNVTWREPYRVSDHNEEWEMHCVVNFHLERGIHMHQYEMPTGGPTSRGCVRLIDADAAWVYSWVQTWQTTTGTDDKDSAEGQLIQPGTTVLVIGTEPDDEPTLFKGHAGQPMLVKASLPDHPP